MNAVLLHKYGGIDQLSCESIADATTGPCEVLVKMIGTSLNPVDHKIRTSRIQLEAETGGLGRIALFR